MRLLLDTHALIWASLDSSQLSSTARSALDDDRNIVVVSVVSLWEVVTKQAAGTLVIRAELRAWLADRGIPAVGVRMQGQRHPVAEKENDAGDDEKGGHDPPRSRAGCGPPRRLGSPWYPIGLPRPRWTDSEVSAP